MATKTEKTASMKWAPLILAIVAFAGLGGLLAFGVTQARNSSGGDGGATGKLNLRAAPDFTVPLFTGGTGEFTLSDQVGHPVVLNFWGSWCPPCRAEFPALQAVADEYKDAGLIIFGVDVQDTESDAKAFLNEQNTTFQTGPDLDGRVTLDYSITGMPSTFFITKDGKIFKKWVGQIDEEKLSTFIEELLAL